MAATVLRHFELFSLKYETFEEKKLMMNKSNHHSKYVNKF